MAKQYSKRSVRGEGECGNPHCDKPRAPDSYLCRKHKREMAMIRDKNDSDPTLTYNQRSDNPNRMLLERNQKQRRRKKPQEPTCCFFGCYETRIPPEPYCYQQSEVGEYG
jgi:hypothetical protein